MNIGIVDVDGMHYPNLALMRIYAWHKMNGDSVKIYDPLFDHPDRIYASKIFTFSPDYQYFPKDADVIKGGSGYDIHSRLPDEIEKTPPDYALYPQFDFAIGFLTRGCCNKCPWCIVPEKEGKISIVGDIEDIGVRKSVKLMDNNFLAADSEFVKEQLEKMAVGKWRIDFNQALDCRRVTMENAKLLAKVKWDKYIRFSCDTPQCIPYLQRAVSLLRENGYKREIFVYCLSIDVSEALHRIEAVANMGCTPFCMPFRDLHDPSYVVPRELKKLANWCNMQNIRKTIPFSQYDPRIKYSAHKTKGEILQ